MELELCFQLDWIERPHSFSPINIQVLLLYVEKFQFLLENPKLLIFGFLSISTQLLHSRQRKKKQPIHFTISQNGCHVWHVSFDIISACVKHQINFIHSSSCVFLKSHEKKDENVCMFARSVICQNALFFPLYNLERLVVIPIEDEKPRNKVLVKFRKTNAVCMWKMQMEFIYHRCEFSCKPFHFQHTVAKT